MGVTVFVPVRMDSKRLPGKPLRLVNGKTLLERCCQSIEASGFEPIVTTPDITIGRYCEAKGIKVVITSLACRNGTERVAEAARILDIDPFEVIVNCQGDMFGWENPSFLQTPIQAVQTDHNIMATVYCPEFDLIDLTYEDTVKVLGNGTRFSFTRSTHREILPNLLGVHFGVYVATNAMFQQYAEAKPSYREVQESLEQHRWNNTDILAVPDSSHPIKVDTYDDLIRAEDLCQ